MTRDLIEHRTGELQVGPFRQRCKAPAEVVFELLVNLPEHLEWSGESMPKTFRLLTMDAPAGPAEVGTEFRTTGADGKKARWHDRSVVTEASRPNLFEFVTEGRRELPNGSESMSVTTIHRYEIIPEGSGCDVVYRGRVDRFAASPGFARAFRAPLLGSLLWWVSCSFARKGFKSLIAAAEQRAH